MSYQVQGHDRCPVRAMGATRCALGVGHNNHHVTAAGNHFKHQHGRFVDPQLPEQPPTFAGVDYAWKPSEYWNLPAAQSAVADAQTVTAKVLHQAIDSLRDYVDRRDEVVTDQLTRRFTQALYDTDKATRDKLEQRVDAQSTTLQQQVTKVNEHCTELVSLANISSAVADLARRLTALEQTDTEKLSTVMQCPSTEDFDLIGGTVTSRCARVVGHAGQHADGEGDTW